MLPKTFHQRNKVYIIARAYSKGGNGKATSLAGGKLTVPAAFWKVIVVLPVGANDLSRINAQTRVIAVWLPNANTDGTIAWPGYRITVDELEQKTGYDLLSNVSPSVQRVVEARMDAK